MKIGITVDALLTPMTGIGRYTKELCEGIADSSNEIDLAFFDTVRWRRDLPAYPQKLRRSRWKTIRAIEKTLIRREFGKRLCHGTNFFLPDMAEGGILTIHDLSVFRYPESHPAERVKMFEQRFQSSLSRASHLITDSDTVREEVIAFTGWSEDRISAIPLGVSPNFSPAAANAAWNNQHDSFIGFDTPYILCVATFEPRKRIDRAVEAHALFQERTGSTLPLVLIGAEGWQNSSLHDVVQRGISKGRVINLGYVPEADLPDLYSGASLFLYPSIYEGFGFPPLEAMASGTPTIVANRSCLPEVTKGAAALVDPDDIEAFSVEIERCLEDGQWRTHAIETGLKVARDYTWDRCIRQTITVYERAWDDLR